MFLLKNKIMTKDEMLIKYYDIDDERNYEKAQELIKEAMLKGEKYVYLPNEFCPTITGWYVTDNTIERLRKDGFDINKAWNPDEYWSVEWGY